MKKRKAFTLVELLVVIAIIAVLLAILMPSLGVVKSAGKRIQCAKKLAGIGRAFGMYVGQFDNQLPLLEKYKATVPCIESTYLLSRTDGPTYVHLGCLYGAGFIDDGKTFFCPAVEGWLGDFEKRGQNNGTYWGAVHATTYKFADMGPGVSQPNQGWKATLGYCYWPVGKKYATQALLDGMTSTGKTRYKLGVPISAVKMNDLLMSRPIVADNKFHSTKTSGWLIDCLYPDASVNFQKQPRMTGVNGNGAAGDNLGMHSLAENCQFTSDICNGTTIVSDEEKTTNLGTGITPAEFAFTLQP